jgi:cation:H+ antiporter
MAIGNVIGSNICNLSLVLGLTAMFYPILIKDSSIKFDWGLTIGSGLLLFFFIWSDKHLGMTEGIVMVLILIVYTYTLIQNSRKSNQKLAAEGKEVDHDEDVPEIEKINVWKEFGFFAIGIFGLWLGVKLFGESVVEIADHFGMDKAVAGLTVVAIATSLPELITSVIAAFKKNTDLALGNLLGSCIFNVLSILGITGIIKDIDNIQTRILDFDMIWMFAGMLLLLPMIFIYKKFTFASGLVLLLFYVSYTTILILRELHVDIMGMSI